MTIQKENNTLFHGIRQNTDQIIHFIEQQLGGESNSEEHGIKFMDVDYSHENTDHEEKYKVEYEEEYEDNHFDEYKQYLKSSKEESSEEETDNSFEELKENIEVFYDNCVEEENTAHEDYIHQISSGSEDDVAKEHNLIVIPKDTNKDIYKEEDYFPNKVDKSDMILTLADLELPLGTTLHEVPYDKEKSRVRIIGKTKKEYAPTKLMNHDHTYMHYSRWFALSNTGTRNSVYTVTHDMSEEKLRSWNAKTMRQRYGKECIRQSLQFLPKEGGFWSNAYEISLDEHNRPQSIPGVLPAVGYKVKNSKTGKDESIPYSLQDLKYFADTYDIDNLSQLGPIAFFYLLLFRYILDGKRTAEEIFDSSKGNAITWEEVEPLREKLQKTKLDPNTILQEGNTSKACINGSNLFTIGPSWQQENATLFPVGKEIGNNRINKLQNAFDKSTVKNGASPFVVLGIDWNQYEKPIVIKKPRIII